MAVSSTWELPAKPETVALADSPRIDKTELHDLADEEDILEIPYWVFNPPSPDNPGAELHRGKAVSLPAVQADCVIISSVLIFPF
jgi:hypothetical protein